MYNRIELNENEARLFVIIVIMLDVIPSCRAYTKGTSNEEVFSIVCFLLGNSPASQFYMPTFRNTLSVPSS